MPQTWAIPKVDFCQGKHQGYSRGHHRRDIPILLTTATFPPQVLVDTGNHLHISSEQSFFLNLGNHRANIAPSIINMNNSKDYWAIHKILPDLNMITTADNFEKTIIFTNTINSTQIICWDLRKYYGRWWHHCVDFLCANWSPRAKQRVMKIFQKGKIKILIATEAAGMVCDTGHQLLHSWQWD